MSYDPPRALSDRPPEEGFVVQWIHRELLPALKSTRSLVAALAQALNDGSLTFGGLTVRVVTGPPVETDPDGSIAFRVDGGAGTTMYHMEAGVWVGRA